MTRALLFILCIFKLRHVVATIEKGVTIENNEIAKFIANQSIRGGLAVVVSPVDPESAPKHLDLSNFMLFNNGTKIHLKSLPILWTGTKEDPRDFLFADFVPFSYWRTSRLAQGSASFGPLLVFATNQTIDRVRIYNTQDPCCGDNLVDHFRVRVLRHWADPASDATRTEELWSMSFKDMVRGGFRSIGDTTQTPLIFEVDIQTATTLSSHSNSDNDNDSEIDDDSPHHVVVSAESSALALTPQRQYRFTPTVKYFPRFSYNGQEEKVLEYARYKKGGTYIDIGANDGVRHSNTYVLEKYFGWSGLLVEPLARLLKPLVSSRSERNHFLNACVYDRTFNAQFMETDGEGEFSGVADSWPWFDNNAYDTPHWKTSVPCFHIQDVLNAYNYTHVDYLSVDAEGADLIILESIDWSVFSADVVSVECHAHEVDTENALRELFMEQLKYSKMERLDWDLIFFK